jgi:hypothetical protein
MTAKVFSELFNCIDIQWNYLITYALGFLTYSFEWLGFSQNSGPGNAFQVLSYFFHI